MSCEAKVSDFDIETIVEENIFRLQVSVNDVAWVDVVDALKDLPHDVASLLLRKRDDGREIVEEFTVAAELEYQENEGVGFEHVLELD